MDYQQRNKGITSDGAEMVIDGAEEVAGP